MQLAPQAVAVDDKAEEDRRGDGGPNDFEFVVAVTVVGLRAGAFAVFDQVINVNALGQNKDRGGEVENEVEQRVDLLGADRGGFGRPIKIALAHFGQGVERTRQQNESGAEKEFGKDASHGQAAAGVAAGCASVGAGGTASPSAGAAGGAESYLMAGMAFNWFCV